MYVRTYMHDVKFLIIWNLCNMTKESFFDGWYLTCQEQKSWWWRRCGKARRGTPRPKPRTLDNDHLVAWLSRFSNNLESGHSAGPDQTRPERASLTRSWSLQSADPSASAGPGRKITYVLKGHTHRLIDWTLGRQACSPLIQLFFGFASEWETRVVSLWAGGSEK